MTKLRAFLESDRPRRILAGLLFAAVLFPYLSPLRTAFDTQPWAILFAAAIAVLAFPVRVPRILVPLFGILGYALVVFAIGLARGTANPSDGLRSIAGYLAVPLIAYAAFRIYRFLDVRIFLAGAAAWLAVGLVQIAFNPYFLSWVLPRKSTFGAMGRGVTSLAPEPFYYAKVMIALFILNEIFRRERRYGRATYLAVAAALAFQIVISFAGIGVVWLAAGAVAKAIALAWEDGRPDRLASAAVIAMLAIGAACFVLLPGLHLTRGGDILRKAAMNPATLYRQDLSASNRLGNLAVGLYGGLGETKGLGFGIGTEPRGEIPFWLRKYVGEEPSLGRADLGRARPGRLRAGSRRIDFSDLASLDPGLERREGQSQKGRVLADALPALSGRGRFRVSRLSPVRVSRRSPRPQPALRKRTRSGPPLTGQIRIRLMGQGQNPHAEFREQIPLRGAGRPPGAGIELQAETQKLT